MRTFAKPIQTARQVGGYHEKREARSKGAKRSASVSVVSVEQWSAKT